MFKQRRPAIGVLLCILAILAAYSVAVFAANTDETVREWVLGTETELLDTTMSIITHLGNGLVDYAIASALPEDDARIAAQRAVLVTGAATLVLKTIIGMKRPPGPIEYKPMSLNSTYHAMPSGHTATATALALTVGRYYPKYKPLAYSLAVLVGISRLYEDVHWFSNVIAGAGVGYLGAKFVEIHW